MRTALGEFAERRLDIGPVSFLDYVLTGLALHLLASCQD